MKRIMLLMLILVFVSCEEVVDVDLDESSPRLVVEASLLWNTHEEENVQTIRLTTTAPYFTEEVPPVTGAHVLVYTDTGEEFIFEDVGNGIYRNEKVTPLLETTYHLVIEYQNETYTATEELIPVPELGYVVQEKGGFSGEDLEFKIYYRDPPNQENYYLFRYINDHISLQIYDDKFTDGNQTFAFFSDEDANQGDVVGFEIQGISQSFYEYMFILRSQSGSANGGPFQTQPSVVRGNIINTTNPDNYAFGFFRLSGTNFLVHEVQ